MSRICTACAFTRIALYQYIRTHFGVSRVSTYTEHITHNEIWLNHARFVVIVFAMDCHCAHSCWDLPSHIHRFLRPKFAYIHFQLFGLNRVNEVFPPHNFVLLFLWRSVQCAISWLGTLTLLLKEFYSQLVFKNANKRNQLVWARFILDADLQK